MYDIKSLIRRLSQPMWLEGVREKLIWREDTLGVFNIFYILTGKPKLEQITNEFLKRNEHLWDEAQRLAWHPLDGAPIERTATVLRPKEFADWLEKNRPLPEGFNLKKFKEKI